MEEGVLVTLRAKTQTLHKLVEQTAVSKAIISPGLTKDNYIHYLHKVKCLHTSAEESVFPVLTTYLDDIVERRKSDKILLDLQSLNAAPAACNIPFIDGNFVANPNFCFGMMYVIEGSTLGGIHIVKNVMASLGSDTGIATHFLTVYGQHTGSKWKFFLEKLDKYSTSVTAAGVDEIIEGAIYGFNRTYELFKV